ncbi:MAG: hypothetical protein HYS26_03730 [Candidatus Kaiserbacteria bacterium]|nr:MAG: hypothetical protein HYS26_03730 [Candidatus Kaiserbacteria bacterium]
MADDDSNLCSLLISFGSIANPTPQQLEYLKVLRTMSHEALGQIVHTKLRKYLELHGVKCFEEANMVLRRADFADVSGKH